MSKFSAIIGLACAIAASAFAAAPASAASCGVTGAAVANSTINYDPFSGSGLSQVTIPLVLTRVSNGSDKTQSVNFVLTQPSGSPGYQVLYNGTSILYTEGQTGTHPTINSQAAGEINYGFGGTSQPDTSTPFNLTVTVPASVDLSAGLPINFDISYVCKGTGGLDDVKNPTKLVNAIQINVNVKSALQATYVGSALDFGDIGNISTATVLGSPATYTTPNTNRIFVKSSGPYTVAVQSTNGYKLKFAGGSGASQEINYKVKFLGQTLSAAAPTFTSTTCSRATLSGKNLPITATLLEGGVGKASASYSDTITVTVSPIDATGGTDCTAL